MSRPHGEDDVFYSKSGISDSAGMIAMYLLNDTDLMTFKTNS